MILQGLRQTVLKIKKSETVEDAVELLERLGIFDEETWITTNREHYAKWKFIAESMLRSARKSYCQYSLYQTLITTENTPDSIIQHPQLERMLEAEGFCLHTAIGAIYNWMTQYSIAQIRSTCNTIYVVGNPMTSAEAFANSLVRMFSCVATLDMGDKKCAAVLKYANEVKMAYFPPSTKKFSNVYYNTMLTGRKFTFYSDDGPITVPQIKCVVRLNELPDPESLPTSKHQHAIFYFTEQGSKFSFTSFELKRYFDRYKMAKAYYQRDILCTNDYGALCSANRADVNCPSCSQLYFDMPITD